MKKYEVRLEGSDVLVSILPIHEEQAPDMDFDRLKQLVAETMRSELSSGRLYRKETIKILKPDQKKSKKPCSGKIA